MIVTIVFFVLSTLVFLSGCAVLVTAKSAIHEIEAGIAFLISSIFLSAAAVVDAVNRLTKLIEKEANKP